MNRSSIVKGPRKETHLSTGGWERARDPAGVGNVREILLGFSPMKEMTAGQRCISVRGTASLYSSLPPDMSRSKAVQSVFTVITPGRDCYEGEHFTATLDCPISRRFREKFLRQFTDDNSRNSSTETSKASSYWEHSSHTCIPGKKKHQLLVPETKCDPCRELSKPLQTLEDWLRILPCIQHCA